MRGRGIALLAVAVGVAGLTMRSPITSLPPLFPELSHRLHLSQGMLSLLAATPALCFGVVSAFAASLGRRFGEERLLLAALVVLVAGLLLRGIAPGAMLFPGTILASGAIALLNVLMSSMIKRRWPQRAGLGVGIYLFGLSGGAILGSLFSVPVYRASGDSVPLTLGLWAGPTALAALLWLPQLAHHGADVVPVTAATQVKVHRHALAWQVTAFMGLQSLLYYAALSWLPTMFRDRGDGAVTAGNLLALMGAANLVTSLLIPVIAHRMRGQRSLVVPSLIGTAAGLAGSVWAPLGSAPAWMIVLGVSQGACLALAIFFMVARAPDPASAASLSGLAQSVGYLVASAGPLGLGLLHSATGGWSIPFTLLLVLCGCELASGVLAGRPLVLPTAASATRVSVSGHRSQASPGQRS